jgi:hypothetical protein
MKAFWVFCSAFTLLASPLYSDTIYQTNSEGKEIVLQRNAIVIQQDSSFVVYKHFDLKERRVVIVRLNRGSLPFRVEINNHARESIIEEWEHFGFKGSITDQAGKVTQLFDFYLDYYPPGGHGSLLESIPPSTAFPLQTDAGGIDNVKFEDVDHVDIQGDHLRLTLRTGKTISGKYVMPTSQPAEVRLLGITEKYDPASQRVFDFSVPLFQLKTISFE